MKKIIALLLALVLVFSLVACNGDGAGDDKATPTPSGDTQPTGNEGEDLTEGGKYMNYPGVTNIDKYKLQAFSDYGKEVVILTTDEIIQDVEAFEAARDVYDIKVVNSIVSPDEYTTKFLAMYMGGESPDVANLGFAINMINKGYLEPLDNHIDFSLGIWKQIKPSIDSLKYNDHIWTVSNFPARWDFVWWNAEIFEELGVKTPQEYFEEDNWTWETYVDCLKATTVDNDADGIPEIYGAGIEDPYMFIAGTGKDFVSINADGTVSNNVLTEEIARAINFYTDVKVNSGGVYDGSDLKEQFAQGKLAMCSAGAWYRVAFPDLIKAGVARVVPYPRDAAAGGIYYLKETFGGSSIPSNAKNKSGAAAYLSASRYNKLYFDLDPERAAELEALTIDEQIEKMGWTLELERWTYAELYSDKYVPTPMHYSSFTLTDWWGEIFFRPQIGEPWATIAQELAPQFDERIAEVLES